MQILIFENQWESVQSSRIVLGDDWWDGGRRQRGDPRVEKRFGVRFSAACDPEGEWRRLVVEDESGIVLVNSSRRCLKVYDGRRYSELCLGCVIDMYMQPTAS